VGIILTGILSSSENDSSEFLLNFDPNFDELDLLDRSPLKVFPMNFILYNNQTASGKVKVVFDHI
jgi:hypothetical protein